MERCPMKSTPRRNKPYKMLKNQTTKINIWEVEGIRKEERNSQGKGVLTRTDPLTIIAGLKAKAKAPKGALCIALWEERNPMKCLKRAKPQGVGRRALSKHAWEKGHENSTQRRKGVLQSAEQSRSTKKKSPREESLTKRPKRQYWRESSSAASKITLPEAVMQTAGIFVIM